MSMKFILMGALLKLFLGTILFSNSCSLLPKGSAQIDRILELSNTSTLGDTDVEDFDSRIKEIRDLFVEAQDREIFLQLFTP